jgi:hypothetical protein
MPRNENLYTSTRIMINSGQFWRCPHGYTLLTDRECWSCAWRAPIAFLQSIGWLPRPKPKVKPVAIENVRLSFKSVMDPRTEGVAKWGVTAELPREAYQELVEGWRKANPEIAGLWPKYQQEGYRFPDEPVIPTKPLVFDDSELARPKEVVVYHPHGRERVVYRGTLVSMQTQMYAAAAMWAEMQEKVVEFGGRYGEGACYDEVTFDDPEGFEKYEAWFKERWGC